MAEIQAPTEATEDPEAADESGPATPTSTLIYEDCSGGLVALAAAVADAPQLRQRVWLQDNAVDEKSLQAMAHVLRDCDIEELQLTEH